MGFVEFNKAKQVFIDAKNKLEDKMLQKSGFYVRNNDEAQKIKEASDKAKLDEKIKYALIPKTEKQEFTGLTIEKEVKPGE